MSTTIIENATQNLLKLVKKMIDLTIMQHDNAKRAIRNGDKKLALDIIEKDKEIDLKNSEIDSEVAFVITKRPLAVHLRRTLAYYSIAREVERIADYAKHISKFVINEDKISASSKARIYKAHKPFRQMLAKVYKTIAAEDLNKAIELANMDQIVNDAQTQVHKKIISSIKDKNSKSAITERIFVLKIVSSIERASDHIVNICEFVAYIKTGSYSALG